MSSPRLDPGATLATRGQPRPLAAPASTLARVSEALPAPMRRVPLPALLSGTGLGAITALVLSLAALRSPAAIEALEEDEPATTTTAEAAAPSAAPSATPAAPPEPPRAPKQELEGARLAGTSALAALAQRYPDDRAVLKALFLAQTSDKKAYAAALRTARHLLEVAADAGADPEVSTPLVTIANGPADTSPVALDLMAGMGPRGAELLFEVAGGSVLLAKTRASQLLRAPEVRRHATPALLVAHDLLESRPCARKAHLAKANAEGDARALPYLKPLVNPTACGGGGFFRRSAGECFRCFTADDKKEIQAAIEAIEARSGGASPAPTEAPSAAP